MITLYDQRYATLDEVYASEEFNNLSKDNKAYSRKYREEHTQKFQKFLNIEGAQFLYKENYGWDKWGWTPHLLYNGVLMQFVESYTTLNLGFLPVICYTCKDAMRHTDAAYAIFKRLPKKVGIPTDKKLQQWSDWCKAYSDAIEAEITASKERAEKNIAMLRKIKGITEINDGFHHIQFELVRNGLRCVITINDYGHIGKDIRPDYETYQDCFKDIEDVG